ncbi:hypothetical protein COU19_02505 [Candidatus Kaiserbacteria bacterium CG10_big_fil_rev_8_21_14_0_10_56_12]|uniref:Uncharacterized protein n=1 Tax=Candidatus Kaiserbacteria bacterium CG10_big_fil_rev_8_21_14_0_10_56_12 TaxID=1974611 RepID=A0A2H0U9B8_9BACT|nr:MAG: hypothetical protein COU19_02505 [Candidatus Kaiserbacteria bacterium CG10_big_fil_rev_8_21_14_0_10_56_12]
MSIEDRLIRNIDNERRHSSTELSPLMKRAYTEAQALLENPDYTIQESEFASLYGDTAVQQDIALTNRLKEQFKARNSPEEERQKKVADIFEAIVLVQSESNEWLGGAQTLKTSPYEDFINKVDMIAEWSTPTDGSRVLALAVDVTFGTMSIRRKLADIKSEIDGDKLGSIKYFRDERKDFMGTRNNVPRAVVGVSESVVEELADLWVQKKNKELSTHPVQHLFIREIETQLSAMHDYAVARGQHGVVQAYTQALASIRPIHNSKLKYKSPALLQDRVASEIASAIETEFRH